MAKSKTTVPLTPAVLHILLALSTIERHGYGIMKQVELDSRGKVKMGPGTLYGSIRRMLEAGMIRESNKEIDLEMDDSSRKKDEPQVRLVTNRQFASHQFGMRP